MTPSQEAIEFNNHGVMLFQQGRYAEALAAYERAIALDPKYSAPWCCKGNVFSEQQRYAEALAAYEKAIELDPKDAFPWHGKGHVFENQKRYDNALAAFEKTLEINPKWALPLNCKGDVFWTQRRYLEAIQSYCRFYHLAHERELIEKLPKWLRRVGPLLAYRILFQAHPDWQISPKIGDLSQKTQDGCQDLLTLLQHVNSDACGLTPFERLKLAGVITFYGGDPLRARDMFEEVDSQDDTDLLGQYYLVRSLHGFCEDAAAELDFAVQQAQAYLADHAAEPELLQMYYAGQIFALAANHAQAQRCFQTINRFLPALYMDMLMLHRQRQLTECDQRIETILECEHARQQQGQRGFLQEMPPLDFDAPEQFWERAHFGEITEAVRLVHDWLDTYEQTPRGSRIRFCCILTAAAQWPPKNSRRFTSGACRPPQNTPRRKTPRNA